MPAQPNGRRPKAHSSQRSLDFFFKPDQKENVPVKQNNSEIAPFISSKHSKPTSISSSQSSALGVRAHASPSSSQPASKAAWWSRSSFGSRIEQVRPLNVNPAPISARRESSATLKRVAATQPSAPSLGSRIKKSKSEFNPNKMLLGPEQQTVLERAVAGESMFFTGAAGTGKSFLMRKIIEVLKKRENQNGELEAPPIVVCATTGLAALNIEGQTIHRWAGIGTGAGATNELIKRCASKKQVVARWRNAKTLIIDEVSMLDATLFDKLETLARSLRSSQKPFGGIQVILTGDFFQLPPVVKGPGSAPLCFEAESWSRVIKTEMLLTTVYRQKGDNKLVSMLTALRENKLTGDMIAAFRALDRPITYNDGFVATELYSRRDQVDRANQVRMAELKSKAFTFDASDSADADARHLLENIGAPYSITLKVGAQVLLTKNIDNTLVNGSRGRISTFCTDLVRPELYRLQGEAGDAALQYYNMLLEHGKPLEDETTQRLERQLSEDQIAQIKSFINGPGIKYPEVVFLDGPPTLMQPTMYTAEERRRVPGLLRPKVLKATRVQLPLILSWALSIHKAQGQTLSRLVVDLNKVFEKGQVYVAISRATRYDQLQVIGFDDSKVRIDERVVKFYQDLAESTAKRLELAAPTST